MRLIQLYEDIPKEWDHSVFDFSVSNPREEYAAFRNMTMYCHKMAGKPLGVGSARTVFNVDNTALKVAQDPLGVAQNKVEAQNLQKYASSGLFIPLVDVASHYRWIQVAIALPLPPHYFDKELGCSIEDAIHTVIPHYIESGELGQVKESELLKKLVMLYKTDFDWSDIDNPHNWGLYKGEPVIIDAGMDASLQSNYR